MKRTINKKNIEIAMKKKYKEVKNKKLLKKIENKLFNYVKKYYPDKFEEMIDFHFYYFNEEVGYVLELAFFESVMMITTLVFSEKEVDIDKKFGLEAYKSFIRYKRIQNLKKNIKYRFV